MQREKLAAFIFPSTDPHNGEYVPDHWKGREWISGFNGSAGTAVVTATSAALWTDSRYFLAAEEQLRGTGFALMKLKIAGTPTIAQWLADELKTSKVTEVGIDGMVASVSVVEELRKELQAAGGLTLRTNLDPLEKIWTDRPPIPEAPAVIQCMEYAGEPAYQKLTRIRQALRAKHADGMIVSALDDIAWTLNLRGSDVHCNPVVVAYLLIQTDKATLYVGKNKLGQTSLLGSLLRTKGDTEDVRSYLKSQGVDVRDYAEVAKGLRKYGEYTILLDPDETSYTLAQAVRCPEVIRAQSPIDGLKVVKNDAEIKGFHDAMLRDGVAMVKFLKWLKPAVEAGGQTEISVSDKLAQLRAEQELFRDLSFDTIAGYEAHGAIVHYEATPETDVALRPSGLLLLDSGAQYLDGTTDITRTIALGPVTDEQRHVYTLVLKGHIALELCKFPEGASGTQIDALAREAMWREGFNYLHGTGHGVGSYLNVHEGNHQIRMEWKPAPLRAGMTVTDEPGIYLDGRFGVRIENTLLIVPHMQTEFGAFLGFEPLTLCPIDLAPVDVSMLTSEEKAWLDGYHQTVYERLSPLLDADEREWLREATRAIG